MRLRYFGAGDVAEGIHGPAQEGQDWQRTLVAEIDGETVGMGTILLSTAHRDSYYTDVTVVPDARRQGIGRKLFEALLAMTPEPHPVHTRTISSHPEREAFARAVGFSELMCCPTPQLNPTSVAAERWIQRHPAPAGVSIVPASHRPFDEVLDAWVDLFVWIHETWMPTFPRETIRELFASAGLAEMDFELSQVAVRDGGIVALTCALPDQWDNRSYLVTETVQRDCEDAIEILGATIAEALRACAARGMTFVEFDGHVADPHFYPLSLTLPITGADPMLIMQHPGRAGRQRPDPLLN